MLANKSFRSSFAVPRRSVVLSVAGVISVPRPSSVMAQAAPSYEVVVKGNPDTNTLGDCPFCHRVLLTLANKNVPYSLTYVDFARKPEWLIAASGGKVPVLRKPGTDFVMPDSDVITEYLEKEVPEPSMKSDVDSVVGSKLFPTFRQFLFSEAGSADEKEKHAALEAELKALNDYLSQPGQGPLFGGDKLNATDAAVAPKLYHCQVALAHYKEYQIPESFTALQTYFDAIKVLPAWQQTDYGAMSIIDGWSKHH